MFKAYKVAGYDFASSVAKDEIAPIPLDFFRQVNIFIPCCISYIKMKVCMYVCVYVRRPAAEPTQAITPKFGVGSSFHPGSAPSQGATQNVGPRGYLPYWPHLKNPEG
jgi:hypothetical protein